MRLGAFLVTLAALPVSYLHLRYNLTPSMPVGLYWATSSWQRGDTVASCVPEPIIAEGLAKGYLGGLGGGPCYRGTLPLVKVLVGVGGDRVDVSPAGVVVNGARWPGSARRYITRDGEPITRWLPYGSFRLGRDKVLLLGENPESWDSRVWGAIPAASVRARWIPLLTSASVGER